MFEPLLTALSALRRVLAVGALATVVVLGSAACDDLMPNVDVEQGDDGGGDGDDEGGGDDEDDEDDEGGGDDEDDEDEDDGGDED
ncbi:DNA primase [Nocardiopsis sp. RV163]|uniref:DNA primase n=1 Tax=Nocardiopsis sp. RV163 TaxID=1661388 RepID=UPI000A99542B|nr:DNA primase [Nocardiopsis sp. RV163]